MKTLIFILGTAAALPLAANAQNVALVLGNDDYADFTSARTESAVDAAVRALGESNFDVTEVRDADFDEAAEALVDFRDEVADAERVIVLLAGHFANDGTRTWMLTGDADEPDAFRVGAEGVLLDPVMEMLSDQQGASAVLVADAGRDLSLGGGLVAGAGRIDPPQGVTVFVGGPRGILSTLRGGLLEPGTSLGSIADDLPNTITAVGYLPRSGAFLQDDGRQAAPRRETVEPVPLENDESAEAALGLDRDARRGVQRDLELLGFDPRGIDGIFGRGTRAAISDWQRANDFGVTGYLREGQLARLREQGQARASELAAEAAARQAEQDRRDTAYWRETGETGTERGLRSYLERFPDGLYAERARQRLEPFEEQRRQQAARADRDAWDRARSADTLEAYNRYLGENPQGAFRAEAQDRVAALQRNVGNADARAEEERVAGNQVVRLLVERRLEQLGSDPGRVDGVFDDDTRRALRRFQTARDLPATGYVTQATMARLLAG